MAKRYPNNKSIQMSFLFIEAREQITGLYYRAKKRDCPYRPVFFFVTRRRLCSADRASFLFWTAAASTRRSPVQSSSYMRKGAKSK